MKNRGIITLGVLFTLILSSFGMFAASADYGDQTDPLVTKSYIDSVLTPDTLAKIDSEITRRKAEFDTSMDTKMSDFRAEIDGKIKGFNGGTVNVSADTVNEIAAEVVRQMNAAGTGASYAKWEVVKLPTGKTLSGAVGTEFLPRSGAGTCAASIINLSGGSELMSGGAVTLNNHYLVTVADRGFKATSDMVVMVCGSYTIK